MNLFCVFTISSSALAFLTETNSSFESLFAIWSISPQRFQYYFYLSIVSRQYQKYWTILILVLCLLCVTPLVCSPYSSFATLLPFVSSWWQRDCELFTHILVLRGSSSTSLRQPQTTHIFADDRMGILSCDFHVLCTSTARILSLFPACTLSLSSLL